MKITIERCDARTSSRSAKLTYHGRVCIRTDGLLSRSCSNACLHVLSCILSTQMPCKEIGWYPCTAGMDLCIVDDKDAKSSFEQTPIKACRAGQASIWSYDHPMAFGDHNCSGPAISAARTDPHCTGWMIGIPKEFLSRPIWSIKSRLYVPGNVSFQRSFDPKWVQMIEDSRYTLHTISVMPNAENPAG